ncbi:hypothetical protein [Nocardia sp. Marseille-Q1738]
MSRRAPASLVRPTEATCRSAIAETKVAAENDFTILAAIPNAVEMLAAFTTNSDSPRVPISIPAPMPRKPASRPDRIRSAAERPLDS